MSRIDEVPSDESSYSAKCYPRRFYRGALEAGDQYGGWASRKGERIVFDTAESV